MGYGFILILAGQWFCAPETKQCELLEADMAPKAPKNGFQFEVDDDGATRVYAANLKASADYIHGRPYKCHKWQTVNHSIRIQRCTFVEK